MFLFQAMLRAGYATDRVLANGNGDISEALRPIILAQAQLTADRYTQPMTCDNLQIALQKLHPTAFYAEFGRYEDSLQFMHHLIEVLADEVIRFGNLFEIIVESRERCKECGNVTRITPGFPGDATLPCLILMLRFPS